MDVEAAAPKEHRERGNRRWRLVARQPAVWVAGVDIFLILLFGAISPGHVFLNAQNFTNMGLDASEIVLLSVSLALLLGAGELDISVGGNIILSSVLGARTTVAIATHGAAAGSFGEYPHLALGIASGIVVSVVAGIAFGLVNGLLVARLRINSFIATLATAGIAVGVSLVITNGSDVENLPQQLQTRFGVYDVFGHVPAPVIVAAVVVAGLYFLLTRTRFGLRTIALGSSRDAAVRAGLRVELHLIVLFALVGLAAGLAAVMDYSRFATTNLSGHETDALSAIAGAVIGGASLYGGEVSILGAALGALLAVILETGLVIQGLQPFYQQIAVGLVLLVAVYIRGRNTQGAEGRRRKRRSARP
jgi:ribose transport system permease protein